MRHATTAARDVVSLSTLIGPFEFERERQRLLNLSARLNLNGPIRVKNETTLRAAVVACLITRVSGMPKRGILRQIFRSSRVFGPPKHTKKTSNGLIVNQNHTYYYQVQQQLFCSGYKYEDLVLSDLKEVIILSIIQSSSFSKNYLPKLQNFYDQYLAPELAYPHVKLGIPRLGKVLENV